MVMKEHSGGSVKGNSTTAMTTKSVYAEFLQGANASTNGDIVIFHFHIYRRPRIMASILRVNTLTDASSNNCIAMSTINQVQQRLGFKL